MLCKSTPAIESALTSNKFFLKIREKMKEAPYQISNEIFNYDVIKTSPKI